MNKRLGTEGEDREPQESPPPVDIVATLREPAAWRLVEGDPPASVELRETHISWVFLTDRYAYKLKKPVRYDFLDFSTLSLRREACLAELSLNRRLAAETYLRVLPVVEAASGAVNVTDHNSTEGSTVVDWIVRMRRLDDASSLESRLRDRRYDQSHLSRLTEHLFSFYQQLAAASISARAYRERFSQHVQGNLSALREASSLHDSLGDCRASVERIHGSQLCLLELQARWFDRRVEQGRVVEGHGDLRPEHIYLEPPTFESSTQIIDCIEFNREYREADILDELAFLAMECDRLDSPGIGEHLLSDYCRVFDDQAPIAMWTFYKSYRAAVRAKVAALRALQMQGDVASRTIDEVRRYLELGRAEVEALGPPLLLVVRGTMGSGKSTVARILAERLQLDVISSDQMRREMFGRSSSRVDFAQGIYSPQQREAVYEAMLARATEAFDGGRSCVLDATFQKLHQGERVLELARHKQARVLFVECRCDDEVARQRIERRRAEGKSASEARAELLEQQQREFCIFPDRWDQCVIETDRVPPETALGACTIEFDHGMVDRTEPFQPCSFGRPLMAWHPQRIVVPFDFSDPSRLALDKAQEIGDKSAEIHVIHVLPDLSVADPGVVWDKVSDESRRQHAEAALREKLTDAYANARLTIRFGDAGHEIAEFAEELKADLIVLSSHGRRGMRRLLIGSVAERVLRLAHCPILVLRRKA